MMFSNGRDKSILHSEPLICVYTASCWSVKHCLPCAVLHCIFHALFPVLREFKTSHLQPSSAVSLQVVLKGNPAQLETGFSFPARVLDQYLRSLLKDTRDTFAVFGISKTYRPEAATLTMNGRLLSLDCLLCQ